MVAPAIHPRRLPLDVAAHHLHGEPVSAADALGRDFCPSPSASDGVACGTPPGSGSGASPGGVGRGRGGRPGPPRRGPDGGFHRRRPDLGRRRPPGPGSAPPAPGLPAHPGRGRRAGRVLRRGGGQPHPPRGIGPTGRCSCPTTAARPCTCSSRPSWPPSIATSRLCTSTCVSCSNWPSTSRDRSGADPGGRSTRPVTAMDGRRSGRVRCRRPSRARPAARRPRLSPHTVTAVGHAHIDCAWLWPVRETKRKCARTFSNQLRLLERYPEHRFVCSQAVQYQWMKDGYPELYQEITEQVADGRWEPVGGMWVEPDTNVPSGESLVRQLVHGKRFFADEFGVETHELWIPDVFGYSAALPQIAGQAGVTALITQKMSWNDTNLFPHSTFWWEGHDGSRLLAHFPPANTYNGDFSVGEVAAQPGQLQGPRAQRPQPVPLRLRRRRRRPDRRTCSSAPAGWPISRGCPGWRSAPSAGSSTGSATRPTGPPHLGRRALPRGPSGHADHPRRRQAGQPPGRGGAPGGRAVVGGRRPRPPRPCSSGPGSCCCSSSSTTSSPVPASTGSTRTPAASTPRSSTPPSRSIEPRPRRRWPAGGRAGRAGRVAFNPRRTTATEVVDLPDGPLARGVARRRAAGRPSPPTGRRPPATRDPVAIGDGWLDNGLLRVSWDADGLLTSVWDREAGREVLAGGRARQPLPAPRGPPEGLRRLGRRPGRISTRSPTSTRWTRSRSSSGIRCGPGCASCGPSAARRSPRPCAWPPGHGGWSSDTEVDWHERHRFLKVAFPVSVRSTRATYEIQHGHIERPTVANTSWDEARFEVCGHRWADLSEPGYGVALLNDCKYGYDIRGHVMRLSLLRGPGLPRPRGRPGRAPLRLRPAAPPGRPFTSGW